LSPLQRSNCDKFNSGGEVVLALQLATALGVQEPITHYLCAFLSYNDLWPLELHIQLQGTLI